MPTGEADIPKSERQGGGRRLGAARVVAVGAWLSLLVVVATWGLLRAGDLWAPATAVMFGPRWLLALPPAVLVPAAAILRRRSLAPLALALLLAVGPVMGFCIPWGRLGAGSPQGPRWRVLTCNMHDAKGDSVRLEKLLAETRPDVVALQEWRDYAPANIFHPGEWHTQRVKGHFLASRYPFRLAERLGRDSDGQDGSVTRYEVTTPSGVVTLFSLHFATPRPGLQDVARGVWNGIAELDAGSTLRREQSERLADKARGVAGPVLLMGDFNTPAESAIFRRVWAPYTDAFAAAGWGWGLTFYSRRVGVRIDHILTGPGLRCDCCWVADDVGSPHRPVLADVRLPAP